MEDMKIKGTGNSRFLKTVANALTLYPTWEAAVEALIAGTFPIDLNGINPAGVETMGTKLNKGNLLSDETAVSYGKTTSAIPNDMWSGLVPIGGIIFVAKPDPPFGFLFCNGATVASADYPELYAVIGNLFGGNSTNFNLPDLRNRFLRGISSGKSPTTNLGTQYNATSIPYLTGSISGDSNTGFTPTVRNADYIVNSSAGKDLKANVYGTVSYKEATIRPENMGLLPCIKY